MKQKQFLMDDGLNIKEQDIIKNLETKPILEWNDKDWLVYHKKQDLQTLEELRKLPKDTKIYTILRRVSSSGMSRIIDMFYIEKNQHISIHFNTDKVFNYKRQNFNGDQGYRVNGCGMDMGFHLVNSLSYKVASKTKDGYYFKQEWV